MSNKGDVLKEVISYKDFCKEKGLNIHSKKSQAQYQLYIEEMDKVNRPYLDEIYRQAQAVKNKSSKK
ncbi:hypothetical protein C9986_00025 [Pseudidiomarina aestuarii]|uniref:Uncharacterized protein n=1 Tax=Pseudidiomarina aestuarii TaxID=624146 RepID=A0A2T4CP02_9GAMM|nr:hypothetical protein C9986_00025 [Pseudidiomarina aestuarii]